MGDSIRTIIDARGERRDGRGMKPGDVYALNAPYRGGTHLPDVTVIMPVFADDADAQPAWFVAARGHHADVGGIAPGSMPPESRDVHEEGVLIDNVLLVDEGRFLRARCARCLGRGAGRRAISDRNISDLKAQVAAARGAPRSCGGWRASRGAELVDAYMGHVMANAEEAVRRLIGPSATARSPMSWTNGASCGCG
jgi:5-oxoprolinase (ATP-hydrolysing)